MKDESCPIKMDTFTPEPEPLRLRIGANGVQSVPYTNYKGETEKRNILPCVLYWGCNEWHPAEQWLLDAWDADRGAVRTFALAGFREGYEKLSVK